MFKKLALVVCCCAFVFFTLSAHADLDPSVTIGDPSCSSFHGPQISVLPGSGNQFFVTVDQNGGGFFAVCNNTGTSWITLDIKFVDPGNLGVLTQPGAITCESDVFTSPCTVTETSNIVDMFFDKHPGGNTHCDGCAIKNGHIMFFSLNLNGCQPDGEVSCEGSGWNPGMNLYAAGNNAAIIPTPEPASLALVGVGLLLVAAQVRRRRRSL